MTDPPGSLAAALAQLQMNLPRITKDAPGQFGKYADLADVSKELLPLMGALGLSFSSRPTIVRGPDGTREFVLAYKLRHVSGESDEGEYLLPTGTPQQLGSAITYARRYSLCAVTGAVADHDDDGQHASQPPPAAARAPRARREPPPERAPANLPRNADGSLSRSQIMDTELAAAGVMTSDQQADHTALRKGAATGRVPGTERLDATPADDPFYDAPPSNGVRAPVAAGNPAAVIAMHFQRLGFTDRDERLKATAALAGRSDITSTKDLTAGEGKLVKSRLERCKDRAALVELLAIGAAPAGAGA